MPALELEPGLGLSAVILLFRITLLLAGAVGIAHLLRQAGPDVRHRFWNGALAVALLLPVLAWALPSLPLPGVVVRTGVEVPAAGVGIGEQAGIGEFVVVGTDAGAGASLGSSSLPRFQEPDRSFAGLRWPGFGTLLIGLWGAGVALSLMAMGVGLVRAHRLASGARTVSGSRWEGQVRELMHRVGLPYDRGPRVRVAVSSRVKSPMAGGLLRPVVLLPEAAEGWTSERREAVLLHELVHVKRRDPAGLLMARLVVALYWMHPLAWVVARRAGEVREEACDARVLGLGTRPSSYARHLLELADAGPGTRRHPSAIGVPGFAGFHHPDLEQRLMAILTPAPSTDFSRRRRGACLAGGLVWAGVLAACAPSVAAPSQPTAVPEPATVPQPAAVPQPGRAQPDTVPAPPVPEPPPAPAVPAPPAPAPAPPAPAPPEPPPPPAAPVPPAGAPLPPASLTTYPQPPDSVQARRLRGTAARLEDEIARLEAVEPRIRAEMARLEDVGPRLKAAVQRLEAEEERVTETMRRLEGQVVRGSLEGPALAERLALIEELSVRSRELATGREQAEVERALAEHLETLPVRMRELEARLAEQGRMVQERIDEIRKELAGHGGEGR